MADRRRLLANTVSLSLGFGLSQFLTAISYVIVARAALPSQFGELSVYIGVAFLAVSVGDFGFTAWLVRELARSPDPDLFPFGIGVRATAALAIGGGWVVVTGALALFDVGSSYAVLFGPWVAVALVCSALTASLQANERMRPVAAVSVVERGILVIICVIGAALGSGVVSMPVGLLVGSLAATTVALFVTRAPVRRVKLAGIRRTLTALRASAAFAWSAFALQLQRLDVAVVSAVAGPTNAGVYAAPARVTNVIGIIPISFTTALFPMASKETGPIWTRQFIGLLGGMFVVMGTIITPLFVLADHLVDVVLGQAYSVSADVLRVILIGVVLGSLNHPIAVVHQARGYDRLVAVVVSVGALFGLASVAVGAWVYGAVGAAFGFIAVQIVIMCGLVGAPELTREKKASVSAV